jgi:Dolichyl-phosphate-mannose-protein mannosyltransferase
VTTPNPGQGNQDQRRVELAKVNPLLVILTVALLPRLAAVHFNTWPHGDVWLDAAVVDSLIERHELEVPLVDVRFYPTSRFGFGYPPDQHPPLWALLGASIRLFWHDSYEALKLVSLVAGLLLVLAVHRCGQDLLGRGPGLFAAALCAVSYLLIDFSGNGSLWGLLALLYVLFVWRLSCFSLSERRNAILVGLIMGAAYLTNYPGVVLPLTFVIVLASRRWKSTQNDSAPAAPPRPPVSASLRLPVSPSARLPVSLLPLAAAAVLVLPWLAFNFATFGNPFWSQPLERLLGGADKHVEVIVQDGEVVKRSLPVANPVGERLRTTVQNLYGNVGFVARQSFVLAPFTGGFALAGLVALLLGAARGHAQAALPLTVLTLTHGAMILFWPTTKFRYLVPLFPLLALVGSWLLWQVKPPDVRNLLAGVALGLAFFTAVWTYRSIPSHTYYYDGGVVTDNFGGQGEIGYVDELQRLERAALAIRAAGPGTVLGPQPLYRMAQQPLVVESAAHSRAVVEHLVQHYGIRYVVAENERIPFYADFLPGRTLWQDDRFALYELT